MHELAHLAVDHLYPGAAAHGPEFRRTMTAAFQQAYKVLPVGLDSAGSGGGYARALLRAQNKEHS